ncbi:MAG: hypothetical protein JWR69_423 [Pedosphaera sp.]|nr:hypothetical protein [Pedosphaera sp.]
MISTMTQDITLGAMVGFLGLFQTLSGPDFLVFYGVWLLTLWVAVLILRAKGFDMPVTTLGGWALFEGVGLLRYMIGSAQGMNRWGFMMIMMAVGTLFFILRAHHFENMGGGDGGGSSCSSGCGGGGGCGGGCGGCGGG